MPKSNFNRDRTTRIFFIHRVDSRFPFISIFRTRSIPMPDYRAFRSNRNTCANLLNAMFANKLFYIRRAITRRSNPRTRIVLSRLRCSRGSIRARKRKHASRRSPTSFERPRVLDRCSRFPPIIPPLFPQNAARQFYSP